MKKFRERCFDIDEKKTAWNVLKMIGMVILGIAACVLMGFVIMWLWNWLMPMIFGLAQVNYWQAVGIFILAKILFGFGGGSSSDHSEKKHKGTIRGEIGREIKKEFDKEFDKEHKKQEDTSSDNDDYDTMYEEWWESEGSKSFEKFFDKNREPGE